MSMLQDFFSFLAEMFREGEELDHETVKERLAEEGYADVTAYDVKEAVSLMYEEGSVFDSQQHSYLEAYTGGSVVDQSFNAGAVGVVNTTPPAPATSSSAAASPSSGYAATSPATYSPPPPPPPLDPGNGYTELDAAVEQIIYVSNITNHTTVNDQDVYEDNDIVVDSSINQTILAAGDVHQDFDTTVVGEEGIAVEGSAEGANLVTGDNDGIITGDVDDSALVNGDNLGINAGDSNVEGNSVGDGNTTVNDAAGNAVGDHATAVNIGDDANAPVSVGGDAIQAAAGAAVATEGGEAVSAINSQVAGDFGSNIANQDGAVATGGGDATDVEATASVVETGEGGQQVIANSAVGAAGFGEGDTSNALITGNHIDDSAIQTGDHNDADVAPTEIVEVDTDVVNIEDSALLGTGVSTDGDAHGELELDVAVTDIDVTEVDLETEAAGH